MRLRPLIIVEIHLEDVWVKKLLNKDTLLHDFGEIIDEQEWWDKLVLIICDIPDDFVNGADLVVFEGCVDCVSVFDFSVAILLLVHVENWEVTLIVVGESFVEQDLHRFWVERHDVKHVGLIKLQKCLIKHLWVRLPIDEVDNIRLSFTKVERLKNQKLSERNLMETNSEDVLVLGFAVWVSDLFLNHDKFLVVTVLEQDMVILLDFKVIGWLQRVKHDVSLILIFELSAFAVAESDDCNTILWKRDKVMSCRS